jgi:hypothetical protein
LFPFQLFVNWRKIAITLKTPADGRTDGASLRYGLFTAVVFSFAFRVEFRLRPETMTKSLEEKPGLSAPDAKVLGDIQTVGWHITGVFARKNEKGPEWAFSIGLFHSFQHPEVVVFGLPFARCMDTVNVIGKEVQKGKRYEPGGEYTDILQDPYRCVFREVDRQHYSDYVGYALWFYEDDPFPLMQCFWPDKKGLFPWNDGCNDYVRNAQPLLFTP